MIELLPRQPKTKWNYCNRKIWRDFVICCVQCFWYERTNWKPICTPNESECDCVRKWNRQNSVEICEQTQMKISKIFDNFDLIQSFCHLNKDRMLYVVYALVTLMARYTQQMTLWSKIIQSHHLLQLQFANTSQIYEYCSRRLFASLLSVVVCLHSNSIGSFIYLLAHEHMHSCAHTHTRIHVQCTLHYTLWKYAI